MMDPLDQHLTDAGAAWRQSQPEPPDLDRLVAGLGRPRSRIWSPRLAFDLVARMIQHGAVAAAGVGGIFQPAPNGLSVTPTSTPSPSTTPSPSPGPCSQDPACSSKVPVSSEPSLQPPDPKRATALVDQYEAALISGQWQSAFDLLAPKSPTRDGGYAAYAEERAPYFQSVAGRYVVGAPSQQGVDWTTYEPLIDGADRSRAYLIEVDYPALSGNNAGFEQFVVAPDASGTWRIWPVR
jgi:hypothetical protein